METYTLSNGVTIPKLVLELGKLQKGKKPIIALALHLRRVTHILIQLKFMVTRSQ